MPVKKYNPITPGTHFRVGNSFAELTTDRPEKSLIAPIKRSGGRNHSGKMTVRNRGGGHKRRYRIIDFKRDKEGMPATVKSIEYDPNPPFDAGSPEKVPPEILERYYKMIETAMPDREAKVKAIAKSLGF